MDLIDFAEEYRESPDFSYLRDRNSPYIPGRGAERPTVMLLSDAPSAVENTERKSLAGQPGRILDQLMALAGLRIGENAYVTNMVKYWVGARGLTQSEIEKATPWVKEEWGVLGCPPVIIPLGLNPTRCLLGWRVAGSSLPMSEPGTRFSEVVARPHPIAAGGPTVWPMLHPRYPMKEVRMRPVSEAHWQALGEWLQGKGLV